MKFIKFFLLFFISIQSFGQVNESKIDAYSEDLRQIKLYNDSLKNAKTLSEKLEFYVCLNHHYYNINKNDSAYYYSVLAYNSISAAENSKEVAITLSNIGFWNIQFGNYKDAIKYYLEGLEYFEKKKDTSNIQFFLEQLSFTYNQAKDYKSQLLFAKKHFNYESTLQNTPNYANIGDAYLNLKIYDSALFYFNKDYELSLKDSSVIKSIPIFNLGEINYIFKNYDIALNYFKKALSLFGNDLAKGLLNEYHYPVLYSGLAKTYNKLNKLDSSLFYARKSYNWAIQKRFNSEIVKSSEFLYKLFEQNKLFDSAYVYQSIYLKYNDSLYSAEKLRQLEFTKIQENIRQSKIQEAIQLAQEERERNLILAAIGFFIPVFISLVFLVSKWNKNPKLLTSLGIASLLMLFEFISLLVHPIIEKITHHNVILMYIILLIIASGLVPLHHKMEKFVKERFSNK